ncbi:MAG: prepilin-type N-terminal cleavage/methylation domain-containing protein [Candidatus Sumerlaeia bacterium]
MKGRSAFTLIELLIVVAIIAILAAIAVPNFLEAQTRARVSRAQNDMRSISLAMETYRLDNGGYLLNEGHSWLLGSTRSEADKRLLTTPISYLSSIPDDVFRRVAGTDVTPGVGGFSPSYRIYAVMYTATSTEPGYYRNLNLYPKTAWMTWSIGPDLVTNTDGYRPLGRVLINEALPTASQQIGQDRNGNYIAATGSYWGMRYDPTNGTVSWGDIYRFDGDSINRIN